MKKPYLLIFLIASSLLMSCISRLGRPELNGTVLDYDGNPVAGCQVGETVTDENGRFTLPEIRYNKFIIFEIFALEAPPLFIHEEIEKEGYVKDAIYYFDKFGGGTGKGASWDIGNIYLRKEDEKLNLLRILEGEWLLSGTYGFDTLYMIKKEAQNNFRTERLDEFYYKYETNALPYLYSKKMPDSLSRQQIKLIFGNGASFSVEGLREYTREFHKIDTLAGNGHYIRESDTVLFSFDANLLHGKYMLQQSDLSYLELHRQAKE